MAPNPSCSGHRFNPLDKRCGINLDEIDPAQWKLLEAATDDYIVASKDRFKQLTDILVAPGAPPGAYSNLPEFCLCIRFVDECDLSELGPLLLFCNCCQESSKSAPGASACYLNLNTLGQSTAFEALHTTAMSSFVQQ